MQEEMVSCSNCGKLVSSSKIRLHEAYCAKNFYKCRCGQLVPRNESLVHEKQVHVLINCSYCSQNFEKPAFLEHQRNCEKKPIQKVNVDTEKKIREEDVIELTEADNKIAEIAKQWKEITAAAEQKEEEKRKMSEALNDESKKSFYKKKVIHQNVQHWKGHWSTIEGKTEGIKQKKHFPQKSKFRNGYANSQYQNKLSNSQVSGTLSNTNSKINKDKNIHENRHSYSGKDYLKESHNFKKNNQQELHPLTGKTYYFDMTKPKSFLKGTDLGHGLLKSLPTNPEHPIHEKKTQVELPKFSGSSAVKNGENKLLIQNLNSSKLFPVSSPYLSSSVHIAPQTQSIIPHKSEVIEIEDDMPMPLSISSNPLEKFCTDPDPYSLQVMNAIEESLKDQNPESRFNADLNKALKESLLTCNKIDLSQFVMSSIMFKLLFFSLLQIYYIYFCSIYLIGFN